MCVRLIGWSGLLVTTFLPCLCLLEFACVRFYLLYQLLQYLLVVHDDESMTICGAALLLLLLCPPVMALALQ